MSNKQLTKNLILNSISFLLNFIISFFFTPYLIRVVGKEAYSFFPLVNNIINYSSIITVAVGSMAGRFITMSIYKGDIKSANGFIMNSPSLVLWLNKLQIFKYINSDYLFTTSLPTNRG